MQKKKSLSFRTEKGSLIGQLVSADATRDGKQGSKRRGILHPFVPLILTTNAFCDKNDSSTFLGD